MGSSKAAFWVEGRGSMRLGPGKDETEGRFEEEVTLEILVGFLLNVRSAATPASSSGVSKVTILALSSGERSEPC